MHSAWLIYAFIFGLATPVIYSWMTTFKGRFATVGILFLVASVPPHVAVFFSHPYEGENVWLDVLMIDSVGVQILYLIGIGIMMLALEKIREYRADRRLRRHPA